MLDFILVAGGFAGLFFGGNLLVQGAVDLARRLGVSPLVIGLTLVGFGTSMPELVTSVQAAYLGSPGIAVGNVIGSNIANVLLIVGAAALMRPVPVAARSLHRDGGVMLVATLAGLALVLYGQITRPLAAGLLLALAAYILVTLRTEKTGTDTALTPGTTLTDPPPGPLLRDLLWLGAGIALTVLSARALVMGAVALAQAMQVSDAVIGLTIVAVGTSLPELVTSIVAARKGQSDVAIGNVIGSNIFNILGILGATALLKPIAIPAQFGQTDIWVMLGATLLLLVFARTGWRIGRREGAVMLAGYGGYTAWLLGAA